MSASTQALPTQRLRTLRDCKSLAAVLETAMEFEQTTHQVYQSLGHRVPAEVRPLVLQLAAEAMTQYGHLRDLSRDEQLSDHLEHCVKRPATCADFTDFAYLPDLPDDVLDDDILEYALGIERIAFEHYGYLFDVTPEGPLEDLFAHLAKEKRRRITLLERRWAALFSVL
ncbi:MAG: hypothetical protein WCA32_15015 [Chromatiaceae bacterium]